MRALQRIVILLDRRRRSALRGISLVLGLSALLIAPLSSSVHAAEYRLGVQDKLRIYVHEWPMLTGNFTVGPNGSLTMPLVGELPVAGTEASDVAKAIAERLRSREDMRTPPQVTVDIVEYRPFYILGYVQRPGEYAFRPGMNVLMALSIAGGRYRPVGGDSRWMIQRDAIQFQGNAEALVIEELNLKITEARLEAEAAGKERVEFPPEIESNQALAANRERERRLFETGRIAYEKQQKVREDAIKLLNEELVSMNKQIENELDQLKTVNKEIARARSLISRGMAPLSRAFPLEQTYSQVQRQRRQLEASIIRAKQLVSSVKGQLAAAEDERRKKAMTELKAVRLKMRDLKEKSATTDRLISGLSEVLPTLRIPGSEQTAALRFELVRDINGKQGAILVGPTSPLQPGDIVTVKLETPPASKRSGLAPRAGGAARDFASSDHSSVGRNR